MQNSFLSAYLSCVLLGPAQAAEQDRHLHNPVRPGALSQVDMTLLSGGLLSITATDRSELRAMLASPTDSVLASAPFDSSNRSMVDRVPSGENEVVSVSSAPNIKVQHAEADGSNKRWFVGSTFLMLGNFVRNDKNPPDFTQLNFGYRITPKNVVFLELKRSKFAWPLGIPWGPSFDAPGENYPGYVRQNVIGLAYNHYWWKGLYTGIHAMNAFQNYYDEGNKKIGNGYTLFMTYRFGYQFKFFNNRFFFEPSIGLTHWPVKTNTPESFKVKEDKWPKYFAFEPGLHFGLNF